MIRAFTSTRAKESQDAEADHEELTAFERAKKKFAAYGKQGRAVTTQDEQQRITELKANGKWQEILHDIEFHLDGLGTSESIDTKRSSAVKLASLCANDATKFILRMQQLVSTCFELIPAVQDEGDVVFKIAVLAIVYFLTKDHLAIQSLRQNQFKTLLAMLQAIKIGRKRGRLNALTDELYQVFEKHTAMAKESITEEILLLKVIDQVVAGDRITQFKHSFQQAKGLDVYSSIIQRDTASKEAFWRALRMLEHVSFMDQHVQNELVNRSEVLKILLQTISSAKTTQDHQRESFLAAIRVVINLTNKNQHGCDAIAQHKGTVCLFQAFDRMYQSESKEDHKFEFDSMLLLVSALANCVEHHDENRNTLSQADTIEEAESVCVFLVQFFVKKTESFSSQLFAENKQLLSQDWSVEDLVLAGSVALLIGCLIRRHPVNAAQVLNQFAMYSPHICIRVLEAFIALHSQMGALTQDVLQSVLAIVSEFKQLEKELTRIDTQQRTNKAMAMQDLEKLAAKVVCQPEKRPPLELNTCSPVGTRGRLGRIVTPPAAAFRLSPEKSVRPRLDTPDSVYEMPKGRAADKKKKIPFALGASRKKKQRATLPPPAKAASRELDVFDFQ